MLLAPAQRASCIPGLDNSRRLQRPPIAHRTCLKLDKKCATVVPRVDAKPALCIAEAARGSRLLAHSATHHQHAHGLARTNSTRTTVYRAQCGSHIEKFVFEGPHSEQGVALNDLVCSTRKLLLERRGALAEPAMSSLQTSRQHDSRDTLATVKMRSACRGNSAILRTTSAALKLSEASAEAAQRTFLQRTDHHNAQSCAYVMSCVDAAAWQEKGGHRRRGKWPAGAINQHVCGHAL